MDDHRHPEAYKEWITSITDTFRSIPGIGLYMSRQLARSCCLRFAPANLDLETLKSLDPDQGGHLDKFANVIPVPGIPPVHYAMVACLLKDVKPRRLVDCNWTTRPPISRATACMPPRQPTRVSAMAPWPN